MVSGYSFERTAAARARVLIVDDDEYVLALLKDVLEMEDCYDVSTASNGVEAREMLEADYYNVAITDLTMPIMGGLSLMQWAQVSHPGTLWIVLSGQATVKDAVEAVHLGAYDFIQKPLDLLSNLTVTVRNAVQQQRMAAEQVRLNSSLEQSNVQLGQRVEELSIAYDLLTAQAETIDHDLRRAELIQRALLTYEPPPMYGVTVNSIYRPCRNVGGDLYEINRVDDKHLVFYIADAAGHGVSAAMLAVLFKHRIDVLDNAGQLRQPADVLNSVNEALLTECGAPGLFITVAFCLFNMDSGDLTVASAGHPPLLVNRASGETERIYHTGPALGLVSKAKFAQKKIRLATGDSVLLYTDGLFEAVDSNQALRSDDLADILGRKDLVANRGQKLLNEVLEMAKDRSGQDHQEDDITMVMLTASEGGKTILDNGKPEPITISEVSSTSPLAQVLAGKSDENIFLCIEGRANWTFCAAFHEVCINYIDLGQAITLDLSLCSQLDSTFYGTIYEIASHSELCGVDFAIQGLLPPIQQQFEELGMDKVFAHVAVEMEPLPNHMLPIGQEGSCDWIDQQQMLHAHEVLASLSEKNQQEFSLLIDRLRAESKQMEEQNNPEQLDTQQQEIS